MFIADLKDSSVAQEIELKGWIYNARFSGSIAFLQLRDGTGFIQCIVEKSKVSEEIWNDVTKITSESSLVLKGIVQKHPKNNTFEISVTNISNLNIALEYPIGAKEHGPDFLLDWRHLWLRSPKQWAIMKVRDTIIRATYDWFNQNLFTKIDSPILTANACEGTTELFEINYFDRPAYLSQSGQLYLEAAIMAHGRVFDFGPVFRAEKSKTRRHLTEFWMMDAEMAFMSHKGNMEVQEQLISYIVARVLEERQEELKILERDIELLKKVVPPFPRIAHLEAVKILQSLGSDIKERDDLGADDETILTKQYDRPIFIEKYPAEVKAFYMKQDPEDPTRVLNSDMLAPEGYGEIIGGSQREDNLETLTKKIQEHNLPLEAFSWYLDTRRYGSVEHAGFGYGLERIVAWVCGLQHIRETIPFPRLINRLEP